MLPPASSEYGAYTLRVRWVSHPVSGGWEPNALIASWVRIDPRLVESLADDGNDPSNPLATLPFADEICDEALNVCDLHAICGDPAYRRTVEAAEYYSTIPNARIRERVLGGEPTLRRLTYRLMGYQPLTQLGATIRYAALRELLDGPPSAQLRGGAGTERAEVEDRSAPSIWLTADVPTGPSNPFAFDEIDAHRGVPVVPTSDSGDANTHG